MEGKGKKIKIIDDNGDDQLNERAEDERGEEDDDNNQGVKKG